MVQQEFPEEILDMFFCELARECRNADQGLKSSSQLALQSCLLVSRSFCHHSRRYLFSSITLVHSREKGLPQRVKHLMEFLHSELPIGGIARHIKSVRICIFDDDIPPSGPIDESLDNSLVVFLRAMIGNDCGIRDFMFIFSGSGGDLEWDRMSSSLQKSIADTVRSSHATDVCIFDISRIPRAVFVNPHLKHLRLRSTDREALRPYIQEPHTSLRTPSTSEPVLYQNRFESFDTDHAYPMEYFEQDDMESSSSKSSFSQLLTLNSSILAAADFIDCMKILDKAACTLQNIHLCFRYTHDPPKQLHFEHFPQLHHLKLQYSYGTILEPFVENGIGHILRLLGSSSASNSLSSIHIVVTHIWASSYPHAALLSLAPGSNTGWLALDDLLSGPKYISLKNVLFLLRIHFSRKPRTPSAENFTTDFTGHIEAVFPTVLKSKSLKIVVEIE
ncbi:hypothetical protein GALMADRAFT_225207 [Galerina marginata CBS 339.88]|uniref:F-box domain-containing protein n=1 Tax=Galerina marginata (strain CBS 339.88) TaxID=685588 RepID=A0A067TDL6_GALM3|nr:hypothetical protein GALMADRAFT_225207 [Galerina marginata CBS 339.88]